MKSLFIDLYLKMSEIRSINLFFLFIPLLANTSKEDANTSSTSGQNRTKSKSPSTGTADQKPTRITINSKFIRHLIGEKLQKESLNSKLSKLKKAKPEKLLLSQKISGEVTTSETTNEPESDQANTTLIITIRVF